MSLDHGLLNVPLSRRGDIDKQIDKYKAEQSGIRAQRIKDARKVHRALVDEAKAMIAKVSDERMAELGKPHGMTAKQCRKLWVSLARTTPEVVTKAMQKELGL